MSQILKNTRVLLTRTLAQSKDLRSLIESAGGTVDVFPCLDIQPCHDEKQLEHLCNQFSEIDWMIFTSANAVHFGLDILEAFSLNTFSQIKIAAIGPSTQNALSERGILIDKIGDAPFTSESLWRLISKEDLNQKKCCLVKGKGGRTFLETQLKTVGAEVLNFECYERTLPKTSVEKAKFIFLEKMDYVVCMSGETLENLVAIFPDKKASLLKIPVVVVSQRLAALAAEKKFSKILVAENTSVKAIVDVLSDHVVRKSA